MITKDEIIKRLEANSYAAEYAAYNYNGSKREHLIPGAIESTCPWMQLLIEIRNNEQMVKELKESSVVIGNVIRTLPVEIVDFINDFCDVVKNTDVCRDGEIQAEWIKYNKNKDGKVSV